MADRTVYEKKIFWRSVLAASFLHFGVLIGLVWAGYAQPPEPLRTLAVVDFANYDPEAGSGGASDNDEVMEPTPLPAQAEILPTPGETEQEPEPEEPLSLIESKAELAAPLPLPPPPEKIKPRPADKPKPKPKMKPRPAQAYRPGAADASGEVKTAGGNEGQGAGGVGSGKGRGNPDLLRAYTAQIQRKLNRYKKYPPEARAQSLAGSVTVNFTVSSQGQIISSRLVSGSGHQALDHEAMALLKRVSPLPPIPADLNRSSLNLSVPVYFSVH
ncbi:MAG: energy transducer TonB [Candidatus Adiutrix sp.]|nr:energy transducer TonB [Candidatus Adiutrix sp.]